MNSLERFQQRIKGEPVDRPPNFDIFMTRAAHHIGQPLRNYYLDHQVLVQANLAVLEDFDLDIVQAISDPYREAADLGLAVEFPEDSLPVNRKPLLAQPGDLTQLRQVAPADGRRMSDRLAAVTELRRQVGGRVPVMGWVEGGLAEAADLRGMTQLLQDVYDRPEWLAELVDFCTETAVAFARAQIEAGADIIGVGDAICSQISPRMYRQYALPAEKRIFTAIHNMGAQGRLHICGNTSRLLLDMSRSGADIFDLDWMVDMAAARSHLGRQAVLCGNMDPVAVMLRGTPEQVVESTLAALAVAGPRGISAAGCEIPDDTPVENLRAQARALRSASEI